MLRVAYIYLYLNTWCIIEETLYFDFVEVYIIFGFFGHNLDYSFKNEEKYRILFIS